MALKFVVPSGAQVIDLTRDEDRSMTSKSSRVAVREVILYFKKANRKLNDRITEMDKRVEDEITTLKAALPLTSGPSYQSGSAHSPITKSSNAPVHVETGSTDSSSSVAMLVATTKATDVSSMDTNTSTGADAKPAASVASTHDAGTQTRTEIAAEQLFIRRSKRVMKRSAEAEKDEGLATGSKRAKH